MVEQASVRYGGGDWRHRWEERPRWVDYVVTVLTQAGLTAILLALSPVFPLSHYPIPYVLVTMMIAYVFGAGPAVLSGVLGWIAFDYYFVHPIHTLFWPIAVGREAWAKQAAFILGIVAVSIAMVQARKSKQRIEQLADETSALNVSLRKEADERERVVEQLEEYTHMLDLAHIVVRGLDDRILFWNKGAEALYGWTKEEAVGKTTNELFRTVLPAPVDQIKDQMLRDGEWQGELLHTRKDGSAITLASHWFLHRDESGNPKAFIEVNNDISELKKTEEALGESEQRFRTMVDAIPQLAWMADPDGYIFWYNQRWYEYTGTTPEEMEGWGWQGVHDPDVLPKVLESWKKSIATGLPFEMEFPLRAADGHFGRFLTRVRPLKDAEGRVTRWFGTNTDVSELLEVQEALRESDERYRTLFTSMREAFMLTDMIFDDGGRPYDWRYVEANPAFGLNTGIDAEGVIGRTAREVLPNIEAYWIETFGNVAVTGQPDRIEQYNKDLDRYFLASAFSPAPGQVAVLFTDVTDRRQAEEEVRRLNAELEQRVQARTAELEASNKELEAFSYSVSHDLRAPLRAIDGFSNAVLKHYVDSLDDRGQDYLRRIRAAAQRMAQLIDDILGLSRASRAEMHPQPVDLSTMASEILRDLQKSHPERRAEITVEPGLVVNADSHLLRIALDNLLGNAWKFTGQRDVARVEVGSLEQDGERVYFIRDNGAGFNPTYADKLFSPFQRLHGEDEFPGTGIGLALVQRIVRRHGGRIWAESIVGQGATFYFTLEEAEG